MCNLMYTVYIGSYIKFVVMGYHMIQSCSRRTLPHSPDVMTVECWGYYNHMWTARVPPWSWLQFSQIQNLGATTPTKNRSNPIWVERPITWFAYHWPNRWLTRAPTSADSQLNKIVAKRLLQETPHCLGHVPIWFLLYSKQFLGPLGCWKLAFACRNHGITSHRTSLDIAATMSTKNIKNSFYLVLVLLPASSLRRNLMKMMRKMREKAEKAVCWSHCSTLHESWAPGVYVCIFGLCKLRHYSSYRLKIKHIPKRWSFWSSSASTSIKEHRPSSEQDVSEVPDAWAAPECWLRRGNESCWMDAEWIGAGTQLFAVS